MENWHVGKPHEARQNVAIFPVTGSHLVNCFVLRDQLSNRHYALLLPVFDPYLHLFLKLVDRAVLKREDSFMGLDQDLDQPILESSWSPPYMSVKIHVFEVVGALNMRLAVQCSN